jgi:hypothetical protein
MSFSWTVHTLAAKSAIGIVHADEFTSGDMSRMRRAVRLALRGAIA